MSTGAIGLRIPQVVSAATPEVLATDCPRRCERPRRRLHPTMFARFHCEPELNLLIKPRKRLQRDQTDTLAVPEAPNLTCTRVVF